MHSPASTELQESLLQSDGRPGSARGIAGLVRVAENSPEHVVVTDTAGVILYANPAFRENCGYGQDELVGRTHRLLHSGLQSAEFYQQLRTTLEQGRPFRGVFANRRRDGELYYEEKTIRPFVDAVGKITHFVATGRDVSESVRAQQRMEQLANYDSLTGLPNRHLFHDRLHQAMAHAARHEEGFCLLFVDLDHFKEVNDREGHARGDVLLTAAAGRLRAAVREEDTVARLGGDEFVLILVGVSTREDADVILEKLCELLRREQGPFGPTPASLGAAFFPRDGGSEHALLASADAAMYCAKLAGGNRWRYCDEGARTDLLGVDADSGLRQKAE